MKKNGFLDSIRVASPCSQDWNAMKGNAKVRFCEHCALEVNNLSAMKRKEAMRLVRQSKGGICVRYIQNPETNAPVFAEKLYRITRRAGIAAGVLGASLTLSTLAYAQGEAVNLVRKTQVETSVENQTDRDKTESPTGTISGIITDSSGAVLSNATVTVFNEKTNVRSVVTTDYKGFYEFKNIAAGTYKLEAGAGAGFTAVEITGIEISAETQFRQDISLNASEQIVVEVTAESPSGEEYGTATAGTIVVVTTKEPLLTAVLNEDFDEVKNLVARGANVNAKDKNYGNSTALHVAVERNNGEIAKFLLDMGAKVNARDSNRNTPLMSIDFETSPELVRMLLDHGAKVNAFDSDGDTALIIAADYENAAALRVLIDAGANLDAQNKDGETALIKAAEGDYYECVKALLEAGADPNLRNKDDESALDLCDDEKIEELLKSYNAK